jgi:hypothetical protein
MNLSIETELEADGRWIAEVPQLPGVMAYGATAEEAASKAEVLALRVLSGSSRAKASRSKSTSRLRLRDGLAFREGPTCSCRPSAPWMANQAPVWLTPNIGAPRLA